MGTNDRVSIDMDRITPLLEAIKNVNEYSLNIVRSTKKTIENFEFENIFDEILDFLDQKEIEINALGTVLTEMESSHINASQRIKSYQSLKEKWNKNLGKSKQLREVINDIIGIRLIMNRSYEEILLWVNQLKKDCAYNIKIVDFHEVPKARDDGYRGIHVYFKENPMGFPIELQIWNQDDALLNFYTHDIIYKANKDSSSAEYGLALRMWLDKIPIMPEGVEIGYITYCAS
nr:hypothetical protein [uncultured Niameybacter sp.]